MAKGNPLQQELLKAGLVKKSKVAEVARQQAKARQGKASPTDSGVQRDAERARREKADRDRALEAERKAGARTLELRGQARQIIRDHRIPLAGEGEYRFSAGGAIRSVLVDDDQRRKLASGALVIACLDERYELLPRVPADKVRERDPELIVLDHGQAETTQAPAISPEDEAHYARFEVPDDLVW